MLGGVSWLVWDFFHSFFGFCFIASSTLECDYIEKKPRTLARLESSIKLKNFMLLAEIREDLVRSTRFFNMKQFPLEFVRFPQVLNSQQTCNNHNCIERLIDVQLHNNSLFWTSYFHLEAMQPAKPIWCMKLHPCCINTFIVSERKTARSTEMTQNRHLS